jgi:hypothetical protein
MSHYDETVEHNPGHLMPLGSYLFESFLASHVATVNYKAPPASEEPETPAPPDRSFQDNEGIWKAIIFQNLRRSDINITLENFFLFEWFPRSPGLFYTGAGVSARGEAVRNIEKIGDGIVVYNPYGKASMLDGGVGNIRLKPIDIKNEERFLMSASSNGSCHTGFPVALPSHLYNRCIDEITGRGAVIGTFIGKLKFIPKELEDIYLGYREVPQLYLSVEELRNPSYGQNRPLEELEVSVAVSFQSNYEGSPGIYASYVNFDPGKKGSFQERVSWMEQDYVSQKYKGEVITDFDEQKSHFAKAPFSLKKVMNLKLVQSEAGFITNELNINRLIEHQAQIQIITREVRMGDEYNISGGNIGAVGKNAKAENIHLTNQGGQSPVGGGTGTTSDKPYQAAQWEKIVAVAMAVLVIGVTLFLVIRNQPFADPNLVRLLRIVLSVAAAIAGATIPGFLDVKWSGGGFLIRAGGALALFVITFFGSPTVISSSAQ